MQRNKREKRKEPTASNETPVRTCTALGRTRKLSIQLHWTYNQVNKKSRIYLLKSKNREDTEELEEDDLEELSANNLSFIAEYLSITWGAEYNPKTGVLKMSRVIPKNSVEQGIQSFFHTFKECPSCGEPGRLEVKVPPQGEGEEEREGDKVAVINCPECESIHPVKADNKAAKAVLKSVLSETRLYSTTQAKLPNKTTNSSSNKSFLKRILGLSLLVLLFSLAAVWMGPSLLSQNQPPPGPPGPVDENNEKGDTNDVRPSVSTNTEVKISPNRTAIDVTDYIPALEEEIARADSSLEIFSEEHLSELLWGTYRPNIYFGMRTRTGIDSLILGMMWYEPGTNPYHVQLHHISKSLDDINISWIHHNGRDYGKLIHHLKSDLVFTVYLWKRLGENGGDWVVRVKGDFYDPVKNEKKEVKIALMFYIGVENQNTGYINLSSPQSLAQRPLPGTVKLAGYTPATGDFALILPESKKFSKKEKSSTYFSGIKLKEVWRIEQHLRLIVPKGSKRAHAQLENLIHDGCNVFVLQRFKKIPFEVDMVFLSSLQRFPTAPAILAEANALTDTFLDQILEEKAQEFQNKFEETFGLAARQFSSEYQEFAMVAFSNLMGGIGYFYGQNRIYLPISENSSEQAEQQDYKMSDNVYSLFTATPSRRFFPRGFLWDEGFHQLIISAWDKEISKDMIAHWLSLVHPNGWIPREQILGPEAESSVPAEFIVQYPDHANPPTFYLSIEKFLEKGDLTQHDQLFLKGVFKNLLTNFVWFLKTQKGNTVNSWYWRGSKGNHTLPSGFDDYPRAKVRSEAEEHLDLLCWITLSAHILDKIAKSIDVYDVVQFKLIEDELIVHLEHHWNDEINAYCDYDGLSDSHVKHIGYLSLFPFLFGLIPVDSPRLGFVLDIMEDTKFLKTNFGLRSLSASDSLFETGENYWRGNIFMNVNYLVLRALYRFYSTGDGPYAQRAKSLYNSLRSRLIGNVFRVYQTQKDLFEHYNPHTGAGQGQHPFTGWTSLIVLVMGEMY